MILLLGIAVIAFLISVMIELLMRMGISSMTDVMGSHVEHL